MKSKERYQCGICEDMHDDYDAAAECCAEAKAAAELDPLSRPATAEERAATGRLF